MSYNFKQYLRNLQILHFAMLIGVALVCLVLYFNVGKYGNLEPSQNTFLYVIWTIWGAVLILGFTVGSAKVNASRDGDNLTTKLDRYRSGSIFKYACFEGSALICIVIYFFVNPHPSLQIMVLISWLLMASFFQNKQRITDVIQPSSDELKLIDDENALIANSPK